MFKFNTQERAASRKVFPLLALTKTLSNTTGSLKFTEEFCYFLSKNNVDLHLNFIRERAGKTRGISAVRKNNYSVYKVSQKKQTNKETNKPRKLGEKVIRRSVISRESTFTNFTAVDITLCRYFTAREESNSKTEVP